MNKSALLPYSIRSRDFTVLTSALTPDIAGRAAADMIGVFEELWIDVDGSVTEPGRASYHVTLDPYFRTPLILRCSQVESLTRFTTIDAQARMRVSFA